MIAPIIKTGVALAAGFGASSLTTNLIWAVAPRSPNLIIRGCEVVGVMAVGGMVSGATYKVTQNYLDDLDRSLDELLAITKRY